MSTHEHRSAAPRAELVLTCADLEADLAFFTGTLGFQLRTIYPADAPRVAHLEGHGLRLCLERGEDGPPQRIRLVDPERVEPSVLTAPGGTQVELVPQPAPLSVPPLRASFTSSPLGEAAWGTGRAGMLYRDLLPDRLGGHLVASHIRIPTGGPVPDYVHHHEVRVQLIYVRRGWVELVYEDQGAPFVLETGECVLQPPGIRHRVLASSDGLEVVEVGSPAEHPTHVDHTLELPTGRERPERDFSGQRFTRHRLGEACWEDWRAAGFRARDLGIGAASGGQAQARVVRVEGPERSLGDSLPGSALLWFVLTGSARFACEGREGELGPDDALLFPPDCEHGLTQVSGDFEWLEVELPVSGS